MFDEDGRTVPLSGYRVDAVTDVAVDRLDRMCRDDGPLLLFVSHLEPHHQNNRFRTVGPRGAARRFRDYEVPGDLRGAVGDWRWNYPATLACARAIDDGLGRLLETLDDHGRLDNTLVLFTSDHGSHFRTRNLEYKRSPHDASIRIPLVIAGPGFRSGMRTSRLVSHLDLLPTVVAAAGGTCGNLPGRPLQDVLIGTDWRDEILIQISESQVGRALRTSEHTFAVAAPGLNRWCGRRQSAAWEYRPTHLYDLAVDPDQRRNLVDDDDNRDIFDALACRLANAVETTEGRRPCITLRRRR